METQSLFNILAKFYQTTQHYIPRTSSVGSYLGTTAWQINNNNPFLANPFRNIYQTQNQTKNYQKKNYRS
jgi:hypothetical protein